MNTKHTPGFVTIPSVLPPMVLRTVAAELLAERDRLLSINAELLAALEDVLACPESEVAKRVARAAIAKARG